MTNRDLLTTWILLMGLNLFAQIDCKNTDDVEINSEARRALFLAKANPVGIVQMNDFPCFIQEFESNDLRDKYLRGLHCSYLNLFDSHYNKMSTDFVIIIEVINFKINTAFIFTTDSIYSYLEEFKFSGDYQLIEKCRYEMDFINANALILDLIIAYYI